VVVICHLFLKLVLGAQQKVNFPHNLLASNMLMSIITRSSTRGNRREEYDSKPTLLSI
jgi:hypothetical protein